MANIKKLFVINVLLFTTVVISLMIACAGCSKREIAREPSPVNADEKFLVRVLLYTNKQSCSLQIDSSFTVIDSNSGTVLGDFEKTQEPVTLKISGGKFILADRPIESSRIIIEPNEPYIFTINSETYRGKLEIIMNEDNQYFDVINHIQLESYLAGVLAAEMPNYWEPAALEAQTVAARTYCLYIKDRFGKNRNWDIKRTQANQVYRGVQVESSRVWDAVNKTSGQVLTCEDSNGEKEIFPAYYSSICGGYTENSQSVFGGEFFKPLAGVKCQYCKRIAKKKFFFWPELTLEKKVVTRKLLENYPQLEKLGQIDQIIPRKESEYKDFTRITSVKLIGSTKETDTLRAEDLRLSIDPTGTVIKSAAFKIVDHNDTFTFAEGRGFGHGVGLCQTGAQAMARKDKSAEKILKYYYPDSININIYEKE